MAPPEPIVTMEEFKKWNSFKQEEEKRIELCHKNTDYNLWNDILQNDDSEDIHRERAKSHKHDVDKFIRTPRPTAFPVEVAKVPVILLVGSNEPGTKEIIRFPVSPMFNYELLPTADGRDGHWGKQVIHSHLSLPIEYLKDQRLELVFEANGDDLSLIHI